jgi:hypothetical protein
VLTPAVGEVWARRGEGDFKVCVVVTAVPPGSVTVRYLLPVRGVANVTRTAGRTAFVCGWERLWAAAGGWRGPWR